jgi:hypothetical protein
LVGTELCILHMLTEEKLHPKSSLSSVYIFETRIP